MDIGWKRKVLRFVMVVLLVAFAGPPPQAYAGEAVAAGDSYMTVLQKKGKPDKDVKSGRNELLFYGSSVIELMDGGVVRIDGRPAPRPQTAGKPPAASVQPSGVPAKRIIDFRQQGKAIDLQPLLVEGAYTVVVFYADW